MYNIDVTNPFAGLENLDDVQAIVSGTRAPGENYESRYDGGLEAELQRLNDEADAFKSEATIIALECVNANRAIQDIMNGANPVQAFKMYGFEAEEGESEEASVEKATSTDGFFKRAWKAILGFISSAAAYFAHLLKIKRISGRVFSAIYNDAKKINDKITEAEGNVGNKLDGKKVTVTKALDSHWKTVEEIYASNTKVNSDNVVLPDLAENAADNPDDIQDFITAYAQHFGIVLQGKVMKQESVDEIYNAADEKLNLNGIKDTEEVAASSALSTSKSLIGTIMNYADERKNTEGAKQDAIRAFESAFKNVKKVHKAVKKKIDDDKISADDKTTLTNLSESLKSLGHLAKKQSSVYNKCLKGFATVSNKAISDAAKVVKLMK